jgi:hypothetical protein
MAPSAKGKVQGVTSRRSSITSRPRKPTQLPHPPNCRHHGHHRCGLCRITDWRTEQQANRYHGRCDRQGLQGARGFRRGKQGLPALRRMNSAGFRATQGFFHSKGAR